MAIELPHEQRCSCDHLAFQHVSALPHACGESECRCGGFAAMAEADLFEL
ncbi:hypothetical protein RDV89_10910 [Nocardioides zeae]|uniref:Metallothionein n=1 Tax=Nocardioides imazamoxiresistens TaxID=3231893 RepID=A0ABU3PWP3_9ACTN|nr:hypothetical protein [Nocardioides zeae]MDT9593579.1 hypothetical protein [Nocardioides zeae]